MVSTTPKSVTIIGASVGGLTLGLLLKQHGITPRFFEFRQPEYDLGGAMSLTPNALRCLDSIGAYSRIKSQGYSFEAFTFLTDPEHEITGKFYFGKKDMYGYDSLRVTRKVIIGEMRKMAEEAGIEIIYGKKFTKIVSESSNGVEFEFADGARASDEMLIGCDGIHSKVRSYLFPDVVPRYIGVLGLTYCFPSDNWELGKTLPLPVSLRGKEGSFIITPQTEGGNELFVGRQLKFEKQDRAGWAQLLEDKDALISILQKDPTAWTPLVQAVQSQVSTPDAHFLNVWPFYDLTSEMDRWHSITGRVVIIGDAAHAIPPSAGQGANSAFESSYSLGLLLANLKDNVSLPEALTAWEAYRMERMRGVLRVTNRVMTFRMTDEERAEMPEDMRGELDSDNAGKSWLGWLYNVNIDQDVKEILQSLS